MRYARKADSDALSGERPVEFSIVMPCLNEEATVGTCVTKARAALDRLGIVGEVIVADNGSSDASIEVARSCGARVVSVDVRGYGAALRGGFAAARGTYVIMGDADDSYDFGAIEAFVDCLRAGDELVVGNRFSGGIAPGAMPALHRWIGTPALSLMARRFFHCNIGDFNCGLRGFQRQAVLRLGLNTNGMELASEMIVKATIQGLRISEVPTTLSCDGRNRPPHLRTWRDGWRHLRFMLIYSPRWLFLYPGMLLMILGAAAMGWLLPGPREVDGVGFDVQSLVFAGCAIVLGYQAVLFAGLSTVFATLSGLLPPTRRLSTLLQRVRLEAGLAVGGLLLLVGLVEAVLAFTSWGSHSFGHLNPTNSLRRSVPAVVALMLGFETILASFFFSLLGLAREGVPDLVDVRVVADNR